MEIKPYEKNAKKHSPEQIEKIANSIKEFGMNQQIVVDRNGVIIVGHGRYEALKKLGWEIKPEWVKQVNLTEEQAKAYRLADNKLNESDWNDFLIPELKDLSDDMFKLTGFDFDIIIEKDEKDDEVFSPPKETRTKLGDLYELGVHKVLCGDSTKKEDVEKLMNNDKPDMVFTDPPYGIGYKYNFYVDKRGEEYLDFCDKWFNLICSLSPRFTMITTGWKYQKFWWNKEPRDVMYWIAKNKLTGGTAFYFRKVEPIFLWGQPYKKFDLDFFENVTERKEKIKKNMQHSCPKPVSLITNFVEKGANYNEIVLDLFLGSGTTLIACEKTRRKCYGIELDPKYVDVIVQRYVNFTGVTEVKKNGKIETWIKQ